jgi:DNA-binding response OmpR family regulator
VTKGVPARDCALAGGTWEDEVSQLVHDGFGGTVDPDIAHARLRFGELSVDRHRYVAELAGVGLKLTRLEFDLLEKLACNAGRVVPYRALAEEVFQVRFVPESTVLRVHLAHIRRKLGNASGSIVTVRGRGLLFDPESL